MVAIAVVAHKEKLSRSTEKALRGALVDAGVADVPWHSVPKARKTTAAARRAIDDGADVVMVCGGDGTVRAGAEALVGTDCALAVLPAGTANLFVNAMGLPSDPAEVVALAMSGARRTIDTGTCNDMTFNVMAGTGFDALMIDDADDSKERLGMIAYVRAGVQHARTGSSFDADVRVDGADFFSGAATCVLVGNLGKLKGGLDAFPDASPTDGRLDVAVVTAAGLRDWAGVLWSAARRRPQLSGHAHLGQGASITVKLDGKQLYELDGGSKGKLKRLQFDVRPMSLHVCAPAP